MDLSITDLATSYSIMGTVFGFLADVQQAKDNRIPELDFHLKNLGTLYVDTAGTFCGLGNVFYDFGEFQLAKKCYGRSVDILLKNLEPEHVCFASSYRGLGIVCVALGELQQAKEYHGRALNVLLKNLEPEHVGFASSYHGLGMICVALGELQEAKEYHGRALNVLLKNLGPENVGVAVSYHCLGTVCVSLGELQQAKEYHGRALDIFLKNLGPKHVGVAGSYNGLGYEFFACCEYLHILLKNFGPEQDFMALSYAGVGYSYCSLGDFERAKHNFERAHDILAKRLENISAAVCYRNLAFICDVIGIPKQAKDWSERVETIIRKYNRTERADVPSSSKFQTVHSVPPYILARGSIAKAAYQRALETGKTFDKRAKILLIGQDRVGKTSVLRSLKGELFRQDESSTLGVQIDMPLKHVGEKPWKNSKEEQEKSTFHYKCALNISNQLLTEPPNEIYVDSEVTKQTETDETQRTEGMIGEIGSNVGMYLITKC